MRRSLARFSDSEASNHTPSWADFTTTTPELKFSVHSGAHIRDDLLYWRGQPNLVTHAIFCTGPIQRGDQLAGHTPPIGFNVFGPHACDFAGALSTHQDGFQRYAFQACRTECVPEQRDFVVG